MKERHNLSRIRKRSLALVPALTVAVGSIAYQERLSKQDYNTVLTNSAHLVQVSAEQDRYQAPKFELVNPTAKTMLLPTVLSTSTPDVPVPTQTPEPVFSPTQEIITPVSTKIPNPTLAPTLAPTVEHIEPTPTPEPTVEAAASPDSPTQSYPEQIVIWDILADCETGDGQVGVPYSADWIYNGASGYDGGLQFDPGTWKSLDTGYDFAWQAPREVQIKAAEKLLSISDWGTQWPSCSVRMAALGIIPSVLANYY